MSNEIRSRQEQFEDSIRKGISDLVNRVDVFAEKIGEARAASETTTRWVLIIGSAVIVTSIGAGIAAFYTDGSLHEQLGSQATQLGAQAESLTEIKGKMSAIPSDLKESLATATRTITEVKTKVDDAQGAIEPIGKNVAALAAEQEGNRRKLESLDSLAKRLDSSVSQLSEKVGAIDKSAKEAEKSAKNALATIGEVKKVVDEIPPMAPKEMGHIIVRFDLRRASRIKEEPPQENREAFVAVFEIPIAAPVVIQSAEVLSANVALDPINVSGEQPPPRSDRLTLRSLSCFAVVPKDNVLRLVLGIPQADRADFERTFGDNPQVTGECRIGLSRPISN